MGSKRSQAVVVITGASSGIGKAAALRFADQGAAILLAARREAALEDTAAEVRKRGGRAEIETIDVTREEDMHELARRAVETFGRIDVWVNNAAVTSFGRIEETPTRTFQKIIDTNLMGYVYGVKAALPYFREQGHGVFIMVDSVVATAPQPYTAPYVMTKAAIRRLADCLRMELSLDGADDIHVCTVMPGSIDTPFFQHAANYTGRKTKALDPTYSADEVAHVIVKLADSPKREAFVGNAARMMAAKYALAPGLYERMVARQIDSDHLQQEPVDSTDGNLFEPIPDSTGVSGGWSQSAHPMRRAALGLAVAVPAAWMLWSKRDDIREATTGGR